MSADSSLGVSHDLQASSSQCTTSLVSEEHGSTSSHDSRPKKSRCHVCRKKLGLTGKLVDVIEYTSAVVNDILLCIRILYYAISCQTHVSMDVLYYRF